MPPIPGPGANPNPMRRLRPLAPIRGLSLDLDDTLWDNRSVVPAAEAELHAWLGQHAPRLAQRYDPAGLRGLYPEAVAADPRNAHDMAALRRWTLATALARSGADPALAEPAFQVFQSARHRVPVAPELPALLARLAARWPLVALTNGTIELERLGLAPYFIAQISPAEAGAAKPHRQAFAAAADALGLPTETILHIGDDWYYDVGGALDAGMMAGWFNPGRQPVPDDRIPHLDLTDLTGLLELGT